MPLQKLVMTRGLNSDSSPEMVGEGEARYRLNVRVMSSDNDEIGAAETVLGNTLVSYTLPDGTNKVIGSKEDQKRGLIYYFVWNSVKPDSILQFNISTNEIVPVLVMDLNFDKDHLITGINIIELNQSNHLLYWTDNYVNPADENDYNEPRKINIEKAIAYTAGDYVNGYHTPFNPLWYYRIKQPPLFPPTYTWSGIGSITPVFKFTATTSGTTTILASNTTTVKYDTDPLAPGDGYDTTTYQWTSDVNGTNSVTITNQYDVMSGSQFNVNVYVNGVFVVGEYHGVYGSTATVTI